MNQNIKLGFVKSKAFGLCGVILTAALMMGVSTVASDDEVTEPATEVAASEAAVPEGPIASELPTATEAVASTEAPAGNETPTISTASTEISKEGDTITVKNPEVDMHFTKGETGNGTGKYNNFKVEYKNIQFPDDMTINQGDKIVFHMPAEVSFRTNFDFDVMNPSNEVIGHANIWNHLRWPQRYWEINDCAYRLRETLGT